MKKLKNNCVGMQGVATNTASQREVGLNLQGNDIKPNTLGGCEYSNANVSCVNFKDNKQQVFILIRR